VDLKTASAFRLQASINQKAAGKAREEGRNAWDSLLDMQNP
jgi:hypothetical protein